VVRGRRADSGRAIGLRADMDALPMQEENEFVHKSRHEGLMHGCGHDGHTTMLLAAARYLHETRHFDGTAYLIFQPGEEGYAGAKAMIEDGLFERFPADEVYALHNWPGLPPGRIGVTPGAAMAAADRIEITIDGRGGHGAHPHAAIDPVLVAGHIITAAQSIVSRNVSPIDTAVVSICAMSAGNPGAMSVIPSHAKLVGTVRTFRPATQDMIERRLQELVFSIAAAFGATATLKYERVYPATINHDRQAEFAAAVADTLVGRENVVRNLDPSMGSEDFSFMLQAKPGAFARLGQGGLEAGCFLHNSKYDFNDAVIPLGAGYLAALAEKAMPLPTA
jgi:amidohydrolase